MSRFPARLVDAVYGSNVLFSFRQRADKRAAMMARMTPEERVLMHFFCPTDEHFDALINTAISRYLQLKVGITHPMFPDADYAQGQGRGTQLDQASYRQGSDQGEEHNRAGG